MERAVIHFIILGVISGLTKGAGVLPDGPLKETVGGTMMFTTTLTPAETQFFAITWKFGFENIITSNIQNITEPEYEGRVTLFMSTASLELRNLTETDSGEYSVIIIPFGGQTIEGRTTLRVYAPVSGIMASAKSTDLVEFNSTVSLSCTASGSLLTFLWMNGSSDVAESDRVQLTDGGTNLTIVNVTRYDRGPFKCDVFNPVSNGTSDPINLFISFGPENVDLKFPPQEHFENGSNITLSCSADSTPPAIFSWSLNGDLLSAIGPELRLMNIQVYQGGNYRCHAFNQKTNRYGTSQLFALSVLERISDTSITSSTNLPIEGNSVNLTCEAAGSVLTREWMKTGSDQILAESKVLSFDSLKKTDSGEYSCKTSNPCNTEEATYIMDVHYGPERVQIAGPSEIHLTQTLNLFCFTESNPSASYTWTLNGMEKNKSPLFIKHNAELSDGGNYTCQATNHVTGRTSSVVHKLSVTVRISDTSITSSTNLPIEGNSVNLTCEAAGSVLTREWMKTGSDQILAESKVLSFDSLKKTDSGEYSCKTSNPINTEEATYIMDVHYGPETVQIAGPSEIHLTQTLNLFCFTESNPSASFTWTLNGMEKNKSPLFIKHNAELSDGGNYTCQATNHVTGRTSSVVHKLSVTAPPDKTSRCAAGCIAGIVIACFVIVEGAAAVGFYIYIKKINNTSSQSTFNKEQEEIVYENT